MDKKYYFNSNETGKKIFFSRCLSHLCKPLLKCPQQINTQYAINRKNHSNEIGFVIYFKVQVKYESNKRQTVVKESRV